MQHTDFLQIFLQLCGEFALIVFVTYIDHYL